jgi:hypothetical protein
MPERSEWEAQVARTLAERLVHLKAVEARLDASATAHAALAARVEALDASSARHQGQHQDTWDHLGRRLDGARRRADDLERRLARVQSRQNWHHGGWARAAQRASRSAR